MNPVVLEGFAGPGGMSTGARMAGYTGSLIGIEHDAATCLTAVAAGHTRIRADVSTFPLEHLGPIDGIIQTPPCPPWSTAGAQKGKLDRTSVFERIDAFAAGRWPAERPWADERSKLSAEPMRWAAALRPRWIVLEQVPPALPLWQYMAVHLRAMGYKVWCGVLSAEEYGVPQTRRRAFLMARCDGLPVGPPQPTHQSYRGRRVRDTVPHLFGELLPPPVSIGDALGDAVEPGWVLRSNYGTNGDSQDRGTRRVDEPAATVTSKLGRCKWIDQNGRVVRPMSVREASLLQTFPADYSWRGSKSEQELMVGDAVPTALAAAALGPLIAESRECAA